MNSARARRVQEKTEEADGSFMISFWSGFVSGLALLALQVQMAASDI